MSVRWRGWFAACLMWVLLSGQSYAQEQRKLLDVMRVSAEGDASAALVTPVKGPVRVVRCEVVIVGAGLGGVSAALATTKAGHTVCMTEPTLWVGGQATSQGVSAFDDNRWIDTTGGTSSYLDLSHRIRAYYAAFRRDKTMTEEQAIKGPMSNPGGCWVGRLCFEPEPAEKILRQMLQPALANGLLKLWIHTVPVEVKRSGRRFDSVLTYDFGHSSWMRLQGKYFVEASELGDLLPLSGTLFRIGAESQSETHERNAPSAADPHASQSFTYPFILGKGGVQGGLDEKMPPAYETFLPHYTMVVDYGHGTLLTYGFYEARKGLPGSFWVYRRSVDASRFDAASYPEDRAMINWSSNDHCDANLLSNDSLLQAHALQDAKRASLGFAWWIRHEVPRDDKTGKGYPELAILARAMGSEDGLSQHPYIRESRRIVPVRTVVEEDLAVDFQPGARAVLYPDSVGIGWYPIDIHSCDRQDFVSQSKPYEIPLGSLIARDVDNLMAVGKAMGTTHITNGAYRLHPTEWAAGEAAGSTLAWALEHKVDPTAIDRDPVQMLGLQRALVESGHPIFWYDDVPVGAPDFVAMQMGGVSHWWTPDPGTLHANPMGAVQGSEAARALKDTNQASPTSALIGMEQLTWADLHRFGYNIGLRRGIIRRNDFAKWMLERKPRM
ncbi:MAG: FAD-dependent oxidoreductase [Acidobacteriaceae bacterium]